MAGAGYLAGYRVVEVGPRVGSAYAAKCFAELGADVVRIEPPGGDPLRSEPPFGGDPPVSALFLYLNAGKRSAVLDLAGEAGRAAMRRLVNAADLLVCGHAPADAERLGLLPAQVAAFAPDTIVMNVTSFGLDGPYRDFAGDDALLLALGGLMDATGRPDREPLATYGHLAEYQLGTNAAVAALMALFGRESRGIRQSVDMSGVEIAATLIENAIPLWTMGRRVRLRSGNGYYATGPVLDVHRARDGFFTVSAVTELQWEGLCLAIGRSDWLDDPAMAGWPNRRARLPEINGAIHEWASAYSKLEVFEQLQSLRVPNTPHYEVKELLADPQHAARSFFAPVPDPDVGELLQPTMPFRVDGERLATGPAPKLGEHTEAVLREWAGKREVTRRGTPLPPAAGPRAAPAGVLDGVRVVDLTQAWAGPLCTQLLADFGAQVIRVESAGHPDVFRLSELLGGDTALYERGPFFHSADRNKLSLSLQVDNEEGRRVLRDLVRAADIVIDNFSARVMRNWGFDGGAVLGLNPRAIAISLPAFGHAGPYENHVCYGEAMEGIGGLTALTGYPGEGPMRTGMAQVDAAAAFHAAVAALAALVARERTGKGSAIDLSHFETCNRLIGEEIIAAQLGQPQPPRRGNRHPAYSPQGVYRCAGEDAWVMISVRTDDEWHALAGLVQDTTLADPKLNSAESRRTAHALVDRAIDEWMRGMTKHEAMQACQAAGVPAAAVYKPADIVADPHFIARGFIAQAMHPHTGPEVLPGASFHLSATPGRVAAPAPLFGEHTDAILTEVLGYPPERVAALRREGVTGRLPVIEGATTL